ncbi:MAG TPA: NAD-dependent deacetylase [Firmicutes bacterium]|nr:NAD-dependent deacetylase [Bacillota bacterium]
MNTSPHDLAAAAASRLAAWIAEHAPEGIVVLTGAGISTASGIPDFRSPGTGLWETLDPMEAMSLASFSRDPEHFYRLAMETWLPPILAAKPNPAHFALAELEAAGYIRSVITQNIDGLHQAAGSRQVWEIHGNVRESECLRCGYRGKLDLPAWSAPPGASPAGPPALPASSRPDGASGPPALPPRCPRCQAPLKPAIVLFGEPMSPAFTRAWEAAREAAAMIVVGSSLQVAPAAYLPDLARHLVINNLEPTPADERAELLFPAPAAELWAAVPPLLGLSG